MGRYTHLTLAEREEIRRVLVIVATPDLPQGGSGDEKPSS